MEEGESNKFGHEGDSFTTVGERRRPQQVCYYFVKIKISRARKKISQFVELLQASFQNTPCFHALINISITKTGEKKRRFTSTVHFLYGNKQY